MKVCGLDLLLHLLLVFGKATYGTSFEIFNARTSKYIGHKAKETVQKLAGDGDNVTKSIFLEVLAHFKLMCLFCFYQGEFDFCFVLFPGIWGKCKANSAIEWNSSWVLHTKREWRFYIGFYNLKIKLILEEPHNCIISRIRDFYTHQLEHLPCVKGFLLSIQRTCYAPCSAGKRNKHPRSDISGLLLS